jgi:hypothetical protein
MAKGALFVGWGSIISGRENAAPKVLAEAVQYLQGLQAAGTIDSHDVVMLEPHGGDLEGFVLLKGDKDSIARLRVQDDFVRVITSVQLVHQKVGVVGANTGEEVQSLLDLWGELEAKFN